MPSHSPIRNPVRLIGQVPARCEARAVAPDRRRRFTGEVSELLEYVGSALLVMDRVTLDPAWRGQGLAAVLTCGLPTASAPFPGLVR